MSNLSQKFGDDSLTTIVIVDDRTGITLFSHPTGENCEERVGDKWNKLEAVEATLDSMLRVLKDAPGQSQTDLVNLLAGSLSRLHNTDFASVVRNLRAALELVEKLNVDRVDLRNQAAMDWIRKGKDSQQIPFV